MFSRVFIFCSCVIFLGGCVYDDEPMPEIVTGNGSVSRLIPPRIKLKENANVYKDIPRDWLPPSLVEKGWRAVIIHHSATDEGNADIFGKMHREQYHW